MEKKYIGKVISLRFQYSDSEEIFRGYLLDFNDEWTLIRANPVDYQIDGYVLLRSTFITGYHRSSIDTFHEKILNLKGVNSSKSDAIPLSDIATMITNLSIKHGVFGFYQRSSKAYHVGKVKTIRNKDLKIDYLSPKAVWEKDMPIFKLGNIRYIDFKTDYLDSLMLLNKSKRMIKPSSK